MGWDHRLLYDPVHEHGLENVQFEVPWGDLGSGFWAASEYRVRMLAPGDFEDVYVSFSAAAEGW